jgi:hypothetical protein
MANLQQILTSLGNDQKLGPGYLTPVGTPAPTAHQTCVALKQQFSPFVLVQNPLPNMTNQVGAPNVLFAPAYVHNGAGMPPGIYLDDVSGNVDMSHGSKQPAYVFVS